MACFASRTTAATDAISLRHGSTTETPSLTGRGYQPLRSRNLKTLDRALQRWRIAKAAPYVPKGAHVLDVGCADGALFRLLRGRIGSGVGIDPDLGEPYSAEGIRYIKGRFPDDLGISERFDAITMLAVFEHFDDNTQGRAAAACGALLRTGGRLILTVPEPAVDRIVHMLARLRLVSGMAVHEHHGFEAALTPSRFAGTALAIERHERFQLGLNNLFVFRMS